MALSFPITFSAAPLATGLALDANQFAQALVANLQATISGQFLTGQIGGTAPTSDVGPWANNGHWWFWDSGTNTYVQESLTSTFPSGAIIPFGGTSAPVGFLLCNGAVQLRATFPDLFAVIGTLFGAGDGSSTFNMPDFRGRSPMGSGSGSGLTPRTIGNIPGNETVGLATANLPAHAHSITDVLHGHASPAHIHNISSQDPGHTHGHVITDPGHAHTYVNALNSAGNTTAAGSGFGFAANATGTSVTGLTFVIGGSVSGIINTAQTTAVINPSGTGLSTTNNTGSGTAHANIHPCLVCNFVIKT